MATQTDIQQLIQSIVPSAVNNGNPNTIYNNAPPVLDGQGNWFASHLPTAASLTAFQMDPMANPTVTPWTAPASSGGTGGLTFPGLPDLGEWQPPDGWIPSTGGGGGGGGRPDIPADVPRNRRPVTGSPGRQMVPGTLSYDLTRDLFRPMPTAGMGVFGEGGFSGGSNGRWQHTVDSEGGFQMPAWQQILDAITEPFLPGDLYLSGTGKWDLSNGALGQVANFLGVRPGTVNDLIGFVADRYGSLERAPQWIQDHISDNVHNNMANLTKEISSDMRDQGRDIMEKIMDEFAVPPAAPVNRAPSNSRSAGSQTWLEGEAARDYVKSLNSPTAVMEGLRQQAIASMDKMFKNQIR